MHVENVQPTLPRQKYVRSDYIGMSCDGYVVLTNVEKMSARRARRVSKEKMKNARECIYRGY